MKISLGAITLTLTLATSAAVAAQPPLRIGFLEPPAVKHPQAHRSAALRFAESRGEVLRLSPAKEGGWQGSARCASTPWKNATWYGSMKATTPSRRVLDEPARVDLRAYLDGGGVLLLSAAAGRVLNDLAIEPTPLRVLSTSSLAVVSGIRVIGKHRGHPAFAGLDVKRPLPLTSRGCNALADFYGTAGPHGELLADGGGSGERPLVEYRVGEGRAIFVGWRLADFTTESDAFRPSLEKLFSNLLRYLSEKNDNRARCIVPAGKCRYVRLLGVPFLRAAKAVALAGAGGGVRRPWLCSPAMPPEGSARRRLAVIR